MFSYICVSVAAIALYRPGNAAKEVEETPFPTLPAEYRVNVDGTSSTSLGITSTERPGQTPPQQTYWQLSDKEAGRREDVQPDADDASVYSERTALPGPSNLASQRNSGFRWNERHVDADLSYLQGHLDQ